MKRILLITFVLCCGLLANIAYAETTEKLLGDVSDGSRAVPVHSMELLDENGDKIKADDDPLLAFSTEKTCGACHSYDSVKTGWHFNSMQTEIPAGRQGQPWIYVDESTGTQVPISYRDWQGTFRPGQFGLSARQFVKLFARQMPGGGPGEAETEDPDEIARAMVSGKLEINCLTCHDGHPGHNQAEYANQIVRENFRWAAAATCNFATVTGSARDMPSTYDPLMPTLVEDTTSKPPKIEYLPNTFGPKNNVFFDIRKKILNERCYFCHSAANVEDDEIQEKWHTDEDVHLSAGMSCTDCHRHGIGHNMTRGYEGDSKVSKNPLAESLTCKGCHLGTPDAAPTAGRMGAPVPTHSGIPDLHFDKLACTACHSGPYPKDITGRVKTALAHGLGVYSSDKSPNAPPLIVAAVFAKGYDGKIAPHELIWPAFWASMKDDKVTPLTPNAVRPVIERLVTDIKSKFTDEQVTKVLETLSSEKLVEVQAVYVCAGKILSISADGKLIASEHEAAKPYMWPIAGVRPAPQSLGSGGCGDCHAVDKPFFFGKVSVDSPLASQAGFVEMIKFQAVDPVYTKVFAQSLLAIRVVAGIAVVSCAILAAVLALYAFAGLVRILKLAARKK